MIGVRHTSSKALAHDCFQVNYAQPIRIKGGDKGWSHQPVWADADRYLEEQRAEQELEELDKEQRKKAKEKALKSDLDGGETNDPNLKTDDSEQKEPTAGQEDPMEGLEKAIGAS